jgi:hypothetical protein
MWVLQIQPAEEADRTCKLLAEMGIPEQELASRMRPTEIAILNRAE